MKIWKKKILQLTIVYTELTSFMGFVAQRPEHLTQDAQQNLCLLFAII